MPCRKRRLQVGVTLIEMVIVISITAIIAGGVAVFISRPFEGYIDAARRAELTDIADTALRRITRDLRTALPNSIRIKCVPSGCASTSDVYYLEYLQTSGGGRYRAELANTVPLGDPLEFAAADPTFDVIGTMPTLASVHAPLRGDWIVIYNLASSGTIANAYSGENRAAATAAGNTITLSPSSFKFPYPSPGKRFQVVQHAVTYECNPTTRELRRYWNYGISTAQATPPTTPTDTALLANAISSTDGCSFTFTTSGERTGVVGLAVRIERNGESVRLFQQVHVNNAP
jgi:MSHA biogenesis protein MshO